MVNGYDHAFPGVSVKATIYDINSKEKASQDVTLDIPADSSVRASSCTPVDGISPTYFLKLELHDASGKLRERQFLLALDQARCARLGEEVRDGLHAAKRLRGPERVEYSAAGEAHCSQLDCRRSGKEHVVHAFVENPSSSLAFMVHLRVAQARDGEDVVPIFWDDNYFSLLPGEKREVSARFESAKARSGNLVLTVDGWNVATASSPLAVKEKH